MVRLVRHISSENGPIATEWTANILIEFYASNAIIGFDLGHDLDIKNLLFTRFAQLWVTLI